MYLHDSDDLDEDIPTKSDNPNTPAPTQRNSACLRSKTKLDYRKISQEKAANAKTHLLVLHNSPYLQAS